MLNYLSILRESQMFSDIANEDLKIFLNNAAILEVKKKTILYLEGSTDDNVYLIIKGSVRGYSTLKGKQLVEIFLTEGQVFANFNTLFLGIPSKNTIESMTSCVLLTFSKVFLFNKLQTSPQMHFNFYKILTQYINVYNDRLKLILLYPLAIQSYIKFIEVFKDYYEEFPSKDIASYLGITPEALARVKKSLKLSGSPICEMGDADFSS
ncbi:MAG: hypothetical protein DI598_04785 [Pseudopedobacter saltans]|uniref:Cyclic nucleotide-binding domain-containing protein n=1 Tax=Pseudopedobacter saltans TaxID=151895 RepID=A0A2W5FAY6_9SPHI|nr:MAG: hypothetical protein DI598_04785 [Pseudopedobacter saltans]